MDTPNDVECLTCRVRFASRQYGGELCPACQSQDLFWFLQAQDDRSPERILSDLLYLIHLRDEGGDRIEEDRDVIHDSLATAYERLTGERWSPFE